MARPRGSKNKPKTQPAAAMGDNIEAFSDDQRFALAMHHVRIIRKAEAEKKEADATFKNKWKVAKADGVQDVVKAVFALEKDGIDPIQARIYPQLVDDGLLVPMDRTFGAGGRFPITVHGFQLTHAGRLIYCASCDDPEDQP